MGENYPSTDAPDFFLSAFWLTSRQLSVLVEGMDTQWTEQFGNPIVYSWISWIQSNLLEALQLESGVLLGVHSPICDDPRIGLNSDDTHPQKIMTDLIQHDRIRSDQEFSKAIWTCPICVEELSGKEFVRFHQCGHYCCKECFKQYCSVKIADGDVQLYCTGFKCTTEIGPELLKRFTSKEEFEKWETWLLKRTLDTMEDICYCPRCSNACICETDDVSQCPKCYYTFCNKCLDAYHPGRECLQLLERLEEAEKQFEGKQDRYEYLLSLKAKYLDLQNQVKSMELVEKESRPCPSCSMAITKNGGCNHMFCTYCHTHYCHVCHEMGITYDHFRAGNCVLFDQETIAEWEAEMNGVQKDEGVESISSELEALNLEERKDVRPRLESLDLEGIAKYILDIEKERKPKIVFMVGAGISVNAGIPDFRSPNSGIFSKLKERGIDRPEDVFDISFFRENPQPFYELSKELTSDEFKPTAAHYFMKLLEDKGMLRRCYTQNVDSLERKAGLSSELVIAAHGNFDGAHCIDCKEKYDIDVFKQHVEGGEIMKCSRSRCR